MPIDLSKLSNKELLEYKNRVECDISKYSNIQLAKKIQLNSAYGALGNQYFRYYDVRLAEAVTKSGQLVIRWLEKHINCYLNKLLKTNEIDYVVASDTDSLVITLEKLVEKYFKNTDNIDRVISFMDQMCETILQPVIDASCEELQEYLNAPVQSLKMKRESLSDRSIWLTKKRYVMSVRDQEGVRFNTPKLKIMGIEAIRTSTPAVCRDKIKKCLNVILTGTENELQKFVTQFRNEFKKLKPEEISFPRSVNGLSKYRNDLTIYDKATPIHVKGSLIYNYKLKKMNLLKKYELIKEGNKIKFLYLKEPNPFRDMVIAFPDVLPIEFELNQYVDYDTQFQKTFIEPITLILNVIGWKAEKEKNLNCFFE